ncbi:hypothetical protein K432DRAFT_306764, partial [Lepidopterella palustris CBS 459.81]
FVNVARGDLVDEEILVEALNSGHILAAGLDIYASEPHVHPAPAKGRNVTLTSHSGSGVLDTIVGFERLTVENIEGLLLKVKLLTP